MYLHLLGIESEKKEFLKQAYYLLIAGNGEKDEEQERLLSRFFYEMELYEDYNSIDDLMDELEEEVDEIIEKIEELSDDDEDLMIKLLDKNLVKTFKEEFEASEESVKKAVLFELLTLIYSDGEIQDGENRILNLLQNSIDIKDDVINTMKEVIESIAGLQKISDEIILSD